MTQNSIHTFNAEVNNVLQLMIHSLYGDAKIFLRELISNSSDALEKARYAIQTDGISNNGSAAGEGGDNNDVELGIHVIIDKDKQTLTIEDTGIGMSEQELIANLGTIAKSGTKDFLKKISGLAHGDNAQTASQNQIGQFGVGFYSAFMVADSVSVYSRKQDSENIYLWESNGEESFTVEQCDAAKSHDLNLIRGTRIILHLKESASEYLDKYRIRTLITTYSNYIPFPIYLDVIGEEKSTSPINVGTPLWTKNKSEISTNEYNDFYKYIDSSPYDPLETIHIRAEGGLEYTALLFIPQHKPYDLFNPDRRHRIKFYTRKVFITEDIGSILPAYLRFIRGIVNSDDLPLNISRESIQNDSTIFKIRKSLVKKIFNDLRAMRDNKPEQFETFWNNYGEVMKEGLCDGSLEEKDSILELARFKSMHHPEGNLNLSKYISEMIDGQEAIFYVTGDNIDVVTNNPHLEGFKKRGIDVLLLTDYVDDFWLSVTQDYKNKPLMSALSSNINLNKIKKIQEDDVKENDANKSDDSDGNSDENHSKKSNEDFKDLIDYFKKVLGDKIADVKISGKLIDSPACLSIKEGGMSFRMENVMLEQKQLLRKNPKILEINPSNPVIKKINDIIHNPDHGNNSIYFDSEKLVRFIFDQACLMQGDKIDNPSGFISIVNDMFASALRENT